MEDPSQARTPREVSEAYWAAECRRDVDELLRYYHEDAVYQDPSGTYRGHAEIRRAYEASVRSYPGLEVSIVSEYRVGDRSAIEFLALLRDPSGVRSVVRGVNLVHVRRGRFVSVRSYEDPPSVAEP